MSKIDANYVARTQGLDMLRGMIDGTPVISGGDISAVPSSDRIDFGADTNGAGPDRAADGDRDEYATRGNRDFHDNEQKGYGESTREEGGEESKRRQEDAGHKRKQGGHGLIVQRASDIEIEPVEWLWPGRVAIGKQTLIAGEAGLGKSQVSIAMAAAVTSGGPWPCDEGHAPLGSVLFLCAEDGTADTIVPRLLAAGADLDRVHIVSAVSTEDGNGRRSFNLQGDLHLLEKKIVEIGDARLVVLDPVSSYLGLKIDSHVNAAVRGVLEPVGEMAARLRVAVVSITHPPKGGGTAAINRFIGSVAFVAAARAAFMVTKDANDESRRLFLPVKNNLAPLGQSLAFRLEQRIVGEPGKSILASSVVWESEPIFVSADEALQANEGANREPTAKEDRIEFLRHVLEGGPQPVKEVQRLAIEACLLSEGKPIGESKPFRTARESLGIKPYQPKGEKAAGWCWALPEHHMPSGGSDALQNERASDGGEGI